MILTEVIVLGAPVTSAEDSQDRRTLNQSEKDDDRVYGMYVFGCPIAVGIDN